MRNNAIAPDGFRPLSPSIESASMVVTETSAKYYWSCLNFLLASQVVTHHATTSCYPPSTIFLHRADIITIILSRATTVNISSQVAVMCVGGPTVRMVSIQLPPQSSPPTGRRGKDKAILRHAILFLPERWCNHDCSRQPAGRQREPTRGGVSGPSNKTLTPVMKAKIDLMVVCFASTMPSLFDARLINGRSIKCQTKAHGPRQQTGIGRGG